MSCLLLVQQMETTILNWSSRADANPDLSFGFRLRRALRLVQVSPVSVQRALAAFDSVVQRIEECRNRKRMGRACSKRGDVIPTRRVPARCAICAPIVRIIKAGTPRKRARGSRACLLWPRSVLSATDLVFPQGSGIKIAYESSRTDP